MNDRSKFTSNSFDWILLTIYLALVSIGLLMQYATEVGFEEDQVQFWSSDVGRQATWAILSLILCLIFTIIDWRLLASVSYISNIFGILILILVLVIGTEIKGSKSWFIISGFSIQPSEIVKITTLIALANYCSTYRLNLNSIKEQLICFGLIITPVCLILLQPDAGSALTYFSFFFILFRKGLKSSYFAFGLGIFLTTVISISFDPLLSVAFTVALFILFVLDFQKINLYKALIMTALVLGLYVGYMYDFLMWIVVSYILVAVALYGVSVNRNISRRGIGFIVVFLVLISNSFLISHVFKNVLKPHQQERISVWLRPHESDPQGSLYNIIQSKMAIGSGGFRGKGFLEGTMTKLNYVPEQKTDFIFSTIGEEQGFIGCVGVLVLFFVMIFRILSIGEKSNSSFVLCLSYGVAGLLFVHTFINIGMSIGVAPVIGIPLPFISKGGSSLITFSCMIGMILSTSKKIR